MFVNRERQVVTVGRPIHVVLAVPFALIAHRGASGHRPEHTLASYELAARQGADFIEPDLVITRDGVLVARHEPEISTTTDVADRPEFASRKTTKDLDGTATAGWFAEDFSLAELETLRARERIPRLRPQNTAYDGRFEIPTFQAVLDLRERLSDELGREIGIYPETKHPTYFRRLGLPLEEPLVALLRRNGLDREGAPVFVQSFEAGSLRRLGGELEVPLVQLFGPKGTRPYDSPRAATRARTPTSRRPRGCAASPPTRTAPGRGRTTSSRATPPATRCRRRRSSTMPTPRDCSCTRTSSPRGVAIVDERRRRQRVAM